MEFGWWLIALWGVMMVMAIWAKGLLVTTGLLFCSVLGIIVSYPEGTTDAVRYGMIAVFMLSAGFAMVQMLFGVKRL